MSEFGRLFVRSDRGALVATDIYGRRDGARLRFEFEVGPLLETRVGTHQLRFATSTRRGALDAPGLATPGVGWATLPVRYALTPAGLAP